jgi:hypothetical protein
MDLSGVLKRGVVFVVVVLFVAGIAAAGAAIYQSGSGQTVSEPTSTNEEFQPQNVVPERLPASGTISDIPQAGGQTERKRILIDTAHDNRVNPEAVRPLVRGLVGAGHRVQYLGPDEELDAQLRDADALVVMDPGAPYTEQEASRVSRFTNNGGRVLLAGEPNLNTVQVGLLGAIVSKNRTRLTTLGQQFGISFGTEMIYNLEQNDGNYRNIVASPPRNGTLDGVDRAALHLATSVRVRNGRNLLLSASGSNRYGVDTRQRYPVAVQTRDDDVIAVGDTSLFAETNYAIADNEAFIEHVGTFLVSGDHEPPATPTTPRPTPEPPDFPDELTPPASVQQPGVTPEA